MSLAALMGRSGTLNRHLKATERVAIPKAMEAKVGAATQLFHLCARAQRQMREAMSQMREARKFACTIAQQLETELQRFKRDNKRLQEELEQKDAELQRAKKHISGLVADIKDLEAELEKEEAERTPLNVCDCEPYSEVEGLDDSEDGI